MVYFQRKYNGRKDDGKPLVKAYKGEDHWDFETDEDRELVEAQFEKILRKFASEHKFDVTIVVPSGGELNKFVMSRALSHMPDAKLLKGIIRKLKTYEI